MGRPAPRAGPRTTVDALAYLLGGLIGTIPPRRPWRALVTAGYVLAGVAGSATLVLLTARAPA